MSKKHLSVKSDRDWQALCSEFNVCKRRLRSKEEGLLILSKELDTIRKERDEYKLMAEQLREKYHGQKRKYEERERALGLWSPDNDHVAERRSQSLAQLLCEARAQNKKLQFEAEELRQKMSEAHGDIKLLRESIARQRVGDEGVGARHFPAHEREELVKQIEELREQATILERDLLGKVDDEQEILTEKEYYRLRAERINQELNYILGGDEKRIVDIDALVMEN
ncbi:coiled-coil domain-containing protein 149-B-like, partial [Saccoglossus kowalevskii]|uniref:Coiled-coil domain-containing protein 149-B-like n=1 Tax=Saccoglossus kowalevskii TaxID=10224 RepID=A0ABM0MR62_SACKO